MTVSIQDSDRTTDSNPEIRSTDDQPLSESSPDAVVPTSNNELGETKS